MVMTALFVTTLLGSAAFVIDIGSWFRAQRDTQAIADAAALAGAQSLPDDPDLARARAIDYTRTNGGSNPTISFSSSGWGVNQIKVEIRRDSPGFFAKVLGIDSVNVGAKAVARAMAPGAARYVAPIVVHEQHEKLICRPTPCFDEETTIPLDHLHRPGSGTAAGSFGLISLNNDDIDANTLADWLLNGYSGWMYKDRDYRAAPSANFNNGQFQDALDERMGTELLFPIYRRILGSGSNARYEVIGFAAFIVDRVTGGGSNATLHGHFTKVVWESLAEVNPPSTDLGIRTIELIE
jgi:hypothetical protein